MPGAQQATEDTPFRIDGIGVQDVDADTGPLQVILAVSNGTLTLARTSRPELHPGRRHRRCRPDITSRTLSDLNAALAPLTYRPNLNVSGADTLALEVNDGGGTGSGGRAVARSSIAIQIAAVDDPPTLATNTGLTVPPDGLVTIPATALRMSNPDTAGGSLTFTVMMPPAHGQLLLNGQAVLGTNAAFTRQRR